MIPWDCFTPTETRILSLLSDCEPHSMPQLGQCLSDELSENKNKAVRYHLSNIRRILRPLRIAILLSYPKLDDPHYQLVVRPTPESLGKPTKGKG